jgi:penicillin amidase
MQNIVMADGEGNIGFMVAGAAPKRIAQHGMAGVAPVFGWEAKNEWGAYLTMDELPHDFSTNPNGIATANHKIQGEDTHYSLTADWSSPYRFHRINQLIQSSSKHDLASNMAIQADTLSLAAEPLLELLKETARNDPQFQKILPLINTFQGDMKVDDGGALIFNVWIDQLTRLMFKPKLGVFFEDIYRQRNLREGLIQILNNPDSAWCDHPSTDKKELCKDLSPAALRAALDYLSKRYGSNPDSWKWGKAHLAISQHQPMSNVASLKGLFELKAPIPGDTFTINVGRMNYSNPQEPYAANLAPGMRVIYDLSNLDQSVFMGIGGQSGWVQSKRYREYLGFWSASQYLPLSTNSLTTNQTSIVLKSK